MLKKVSISVISMLTGVIIGMGSGVGVGEAQDAASEEASAWELHHGPMPDQSDNAFYVIKHNRATGETLVLSVIGSADDDKWYRLPIEDKSLSANQ